MKNKQVLSAILHWSSWLLLILAMTLSLAKIKISFLIFLLIVITSGVLLFLSQKLKKGS